MGRCAVAHLVVRRFRPKGAAGVCRYTRVGLDLLPESAFEPRPQPRDAGSDADDLQPMVQEQQFWAAHIRLSYWVLTGGSLSVLVYFVATWPGPHRSVLVSISAGCLVLAIAALLLVDKISTYPWRVTFSFLSTLFTGGVLLVCVYFDGGLSSPLVILMALPVMSAALALPARQVLICGIVTFVELGVVATGPSATARFTSQFAIFCAFLVGAVVVNVGAAIYRSRLEAADARLLVELDQQAHTDSLTGCLNHGAFYERLEVAIERALRHREPLSLLVADVDRFKSFNDSRGHADGDAALVRTAAILTGTCRAIDSVARIGGDEFAVILPSADLLSAATLARRLTVALNDSAQSEVTMSIGYTTLDPNEPTTTRLFRDGDLGLYRAKELGRGRAATVTDSSIGIVAIDITEQPVSSSARPDR
jgi:diguanylate cyclase (GGDEF)-like protein